MTAPSGSASGPAPATGLDDLERPLWRPDWSTPATARPLVLVTLAAAAIVAIWQRRPKR